MIGIALKSCELFLHALFDGFYLLKTWQLFRIDSGQVHMKAYWNNQGQGRRPTTVSFLSSCLTCPISHLYIIRCTLVASLHEIVSDGIEVNHHLLADLWAECLKIEVFKASGHSFDTLAEVVKGLLVPLWNRPSYLIKDVHRYDYWILTKIVKWRSFELKTILIKVREEKRAGMFLYRS